jgi:hypothetical protein
MTTRISIEVPEDANYCAKVETTNYHNYVINTVMPGEEYILYIHKDLRILGIEIHNIGE